MLARGAAGMDEVVEEAVLMYEDLIIALGEGERQSWGIREGHDHMYITWTHSLLSLSTPLLTEPCVEADPTSFLRRRNERPREIEWERFGAALSSVDAVGVGVSYDRKKRGSGISSSVTRTSTWNIM